MNIISSRDAIKLLSDWEHADAPIGVAFVRSASGGMPRVSFWTPSARVKKCSDKSVVFKCESGEFSLDLERADFGELELTEIPFGLFPLGMPRFNRGLRIVLSTAELCFVFDLK